MAAHHGRDQTRLGEQLRIMYRLIDDTPHVDAAVLTAGFDAVQMLARAADPEILEHSLIRNRAVVRALMDAMMADPTTYRLHIDKTMRFVFGLPTGDVSWLKWIRRYLSKYLLMFLQGITIFEARGNTPSSAIGRPAYHPREPEASRAFERDHLTCDPSLNEAELEQRRRNVWTCLVERLVYNDLHLKFIGPQDTGHSHNERRVTRQLFETCFATHRVMLADVDVELHPRLHVPVSMQLQYHTPDHRVTERYVRRALATGRLYDLDVNVYVRKEVKPLNSDDDAGDEYERTQSYFQAPTDWIPVSPGAAPSSSTTASRPPASRGGGRGRPPQWTPNCPGVMDPWHTTTTRPAVYSEAQPTITHPAGRGTPRCSRA